MRQDEIQAQVENIADRILRRLSRSGDAPHLLMLHFLTGSLRNPYELRKTAIRIKNPKFNLISNPESTSDIDSSNITNGIHSNILSEWEVCQIWKYL